MHFRNTIMNFGSTQKHLAWINLPGIRLNAFFDTTRVRQTMKKGMILLGASVINSYSYSEMIVGSAEQAMNILYFIVLNRRIAKRN